MPPVFIARAAKSIPDRRTDWLSVVCCRALGFLQKTFCDGMGRTDRCRQNFSGIFKNCDVIPKK